jgi:dCMP deaminase
MPERIVRPDRDEYYMGIAMAVRRRANCLGNRVGAILVRNDHVIATGYNGTPAGMPNCDEGGCERCKNRAKYPSGQGYDLCICVHAEQNALLMAARFGIAVEGATLYTTMQPCFGCAKEALQTKVAEVVYLHAWQHPSAAARVEYERLLEFFQRGCRQLRLDDPDAAWAVTTRRGAAPSATAPDEPDTGHQMP